MSSSRHATISDMSHWESHRSSHEIQSNSTSAMQREEDHRHSSTHVANAAVADQLHSITTAHPSSLTHIGYSFSSKRTVAAHSDGNGDGDGGAVALEHAPTTANTAAPPTAATNSVPPRPKASLLKVVRHLTPGGMSEVVLAVAESNAQYVCKCAKYTKDKPKKNEICAAAIENELEILRGIQQHGENPHPNIVRLISDELVDDKWIMLEYVPDGSLDEECTPLNLSPQDILSIACQSISAVAFLHEKGILHRDIKPHNILYFRGASSDGESQLIVKLTDFGLAAYEDKASGFAGTTKYAAPEVFQRRVCFESDVWSWACSIAHLATGINPYNGDCTFIPFSDELRDAGLPSSFADMVLSCFASDPRQRPTAKHLESLCCLAENSFPDAVEVSDEDYQQQIIDGAAIVAVEPAIRFRASAFNFRLTLPLERAATHATAAANDEDRYMVPQPQPQPQPRAYSHREHQYPSEGRDPNDNDAGPKPEDEQVLTLHDAAKQGDTEFIHFHASLRADMDARDDDHRTAVHIAAENSNVIVVKLLVYFGADVDACDQDYQTPLHIAASQGHLETVETLVALGANVDFGDEKGITPLHFATRSGHLDTMRALAALGADLNAVDYSSQQNTPILSVAGHGSALFKKPAIKTLAALGADLNVRNSSEQSVMFFAALNGDVDTIKTLAVHGAEVGECDGDKRTALHLAALKGHTKAINLLGSLGAVANARNSSHETPLHVAAKKHHGLDVIDALVVLGADVNVCDGDGVAPIYDPTQVIKKEPSLFNFKLPPDQEELDRRASTIEVLLDRCVKIVSAACLL